MTTYGAGAAVPVRDLERCALGGSMAEALLYGLLETVERDAFLMTWYGRLPVPRIEHGTGPHHPAPGRRDHRGERLPGRAV
ncbi:YcaO-like family protein [Nonomuraea sp. NPDC003709]|uniref:YcaO-like family protein n=1 Tax=Nonomuraea sp. NPDC003709 TaxID=3154450 RepID=UPI0033AD7366